MGGAALEAGCHHHQRIEEVQEYDLARELTGGCLVAHHQTPTLARWSEIPVDRLVSVYC